MAPPSRPWLRLYVEITRDLKIRGMKPEHRWLWVTVMCMASSSPIRGCLMVGSLPASLDDIADEAALPVAKVRNGMAELERRELVERPDGVWMLTNWDARQFETDRSTERVKAFRERRRNVASPVAETAPEGDSESESEVVDNSSTCSEPVAAPPVDDESSASRLFALVMERCADVKMANAKPQNRSAYRDRVIANLKAERGDALRKAILDCPGAPLESLTGFVLGERNNLHLYASKAVNA